MTMRELTYQVSFNTPAFLGNAEQQAQWRTPPFKALLRQWWRVVKAPQLDRPYNVDDLRTAENLLFGAASDDGAEKSHRSLVRLRLTKDSSGGIGWDDGGMKQWPAGGGSVVHPEVKFPVGSDLYLGFGPVEYDKVSKSAKLAESKSSGLKRTAIDDKARATLRLMFPTVHQTDLCAALQLAAWFGTMGSRARNGWGALQVLPDGDDAIEPIPLTRSGIESLAVARTLTSCLKEEWPHAIGRDLQGPLVWKTRIKGDWRQVMRELARIKIEFRTQPSLSLHGVAPGAFSARHLLAYPVTNHAVNGADEWGGKGRLANQIRFKLVREDNQLIGVIVHLPCRLPTAMVNSLPAPVRSRIDTLQLQVWQDVHSMLDKHATRLA
jgi:CRISPR-associated protein Cmr1